MMMFTRKGDVHNSFEASEHCCAALSLQSDTLATPILELREWLARSRVVAAAPGDCPLSHQTLPYEQIT
jgi:hypothetical protein